MLIIIFTNVPPLAAGRDAGGTIGRSPPPDICLSPTSLACLFPLLISKLQRPWHAPPTLRPRPPCPAPPLAARLEGASQEGFTARGEGSAAVLSQAGAAPLNFVSRRPEVKARAAGVMRTRLLLVLHTLCKSSSSSSSLCSLSSLLIKVCYHSYRYNINVIVIIDVIIL
ncbi:hypothetical protein E2C01_091478 [Portunus trituberculatus]|uniref:Uncharacterized protein n=1 Tax=Portunus trituberculatus TaxID=210409 RepID=A0A5B7JP64_PORTR|nr:hypothetical protein [Portunus trituberculatus]